MNGRFSGSIIYEWTQEVNQYGLVTYRDVPTGTAFVVPAPTPLGQEFTLLKSQWATLTPDGSATTWTYPGDMRTAMACPSSTAGSSQWNLDPSAALPTLGVRVFGGRAEVSKTATLSKLTTTSTSNTISGSAGPAQTGPGSAGSENSNSQSSQPENVGNAPSSRKSSGSTIGIGVGVGIAALALLVFLVWFLMRRRKQKKLKMGLNEQAGLEVTGVDTFPPKPEMDAFSAGIAGIGSHESKQKKVIELDGNGKGADISHSQLPVVELPNNETSVEERPGAIGRKPIGESPPKASSPTSNMNSANTPWMDEGRTEFAPIATPQELEEAKEKRAKLGAATALAQAQAGSSHDTREIERLEEEERRLDREIAESERLRNLQIERNRVRKELDERRKFGNQGGGAGGMGGGGG